MGGDVYIGDKSTGTRFTRAQTRDEISTLKDRGLLNSGFVIYNIVGHGTNNTEIWGNLFLKELYVEGILANPLDDTAFNPETDSYPVSEEIFSIMQDLWKERIRITLAQSVSNIDDDTDTQSKRIIKSNL